MTFNHKIFTLSLFGLAFALLGIFVRWEFLIPAAIIMLYNQREILKKKPQKDI